jgi:hypothetical protein
MPANSYNGTLHTLDDTPVVHIRAFCHFFGFIIGNDAFCVQNAHANGKYEAIIGRCMKYAAATDATMQLVTIDHKPLENIEQLYPLGVALGPKIISAWISNTISSTTLAPQSDMLGTTIPMRYKNPQGEMSVVRLYPRAAWAYCDQARLNLCGLTGYSIDYSEVMTRNVAAIVADMINSGDFTMLPAMNGTELIQLVAVMKFLGLAVKPAASS